MKLIITSFFHFDLDCGYEWFVITKNAYELAAMISIHYLFKYYFFFFFFFNFVKLLYFPE